MTQFRSYHEVQMREAARRRKARTGIVVLIAIFAVGWFTPDHLSYATGVVATVIAGLLADRTPA